MRILVTGGTGFIGGYFVPMLLNAGYTVRLLVRDKDRAYKLYGDKCEYFVGDVADKESIKGCCTDVDIVFHLVAKSGNELPTKENMKVYRDINLNGTKNIIKECQNVKRFIYVSSSAAMGVVKETPISEKSECKPYLPYQISKYEAEAMIRELCKNGFPGIIVRPTKVYGINEKDYSYLTLAKLIKKGILPKIGNGKNFTSNIYVSDFANALLKLVVNGNIGETYLLTSEESIGFVEAAKIIADELNVKIRVLKFPAWFMLLAASIEEKFFVLIGKKPIVTKKNIEMTIQDRIYDISKAKEDIGFKPEMTMEKGIRTVIRWYKEKGLI